VNYLEADAKAFATQNREAAMGAAPALQSRQDRIDRYRREAARLRTEAETAHDPDIRRQLRDIARQYEVLALSLTRLMGSDP
jgi:hypothetical protein